jgi:hypothetical protein
MRKRKRKKTEVRVGTVGLEVERVAEAIQIFRNRKTGSRICQMKTKNIRSQRVEIEEGEELETVKGEDVQDAVLKGKRTMKRRSLKAEEKSLKAEGLVQGEWGEARGTSN